MNDAQDADLIVRIRRDARNLVSGKLEELNRDLPDAPEYFALLYTVNKSYEIFTSFLKERDTLTAQDVLFISNAIHAWKSEKFILNKKADLEEAAKVLNKAKKDAAAGRMITLEEFEVLVLITDDECVSMATKLLHLAVPDMYAIIDRHVYRYLVGDGWEEALEKHVYAQCFDYWRLLNKALVEEMDVSDIQESISNWLGYEVTQIRAIELVLYVKGKLKSLALAAGRTVKEPEEEMALA